MSNHTVHEEVLAAACAAKEASVALAQASLTVRNQALLVMADALEANTRVLCEENARDCAVAREKGTKESLIDRLFLDATRVSGMADALRELVALPDPLGKKIESRVLENGIALSRVSVPLGVVAVVYEARPNVTVDAAGICLKSGNAVVLRGGSLAAHSNKAIAEVLAAAAEKAGLPKDSVVSLDSTDRAATDELMQLHGIIDVLIPRGGAGLIQHCIEHSRVPVIETGTGNCHVYLHETADKNHAVAIVENAKCRRYGVCNAAETLLVDEKLSSGVVEAVCARLREHEVVLHVDEPIAHLLNQADIPWVPADESDWETEYLSPDIAIKQVSGVQEAITHINRYGTHHSEAIVADEQTMAGKQAQDVFVAQVDAAAVYVNASTAFTDGGQFGLGAEIGISTQKLHVRGPFALEALTSSKYVLQGAGQVRGV